ncbi:MAG: DUF1737 domain-containing protein [Alphaproteobacteria bacterium]|nr:DUF1737 domain-containing protein [Alphaproteobacteria bacterium]
MKYDVECSNSLDELIQYVNEKLKKGWKCQGGVSIMFQPPHYTVFYQALTKEVVRKSGKATQKTKEK